MPTILAVMELNHCSMDYALSLPTCTFLLHLKHYTLKKLNETDEGREFLADIERFTVTEPDLKALHEIKAQLRK